MQNQMPYIPYQPKQPLQGPIKTIERSIPNILPKHSISNPNLSLDFGVKGQFEGFKGINMVQSPVNQSSRPRHGVLAKSLILPQQELQVQMPEDVLSPKKDIPNRNMGKRTHRPSDHNMQEGHLPINYIPKREEITLNMNFGRIKEEEERKESQILNYPSRNDMKRSMVLPYQRIQSPPPFITQRKQPVKQTKAKISVCSDNFVRIRELGNGKYGRVSLVYEKYTGFVCALKQIQKKLLVQQQITEQFLREVKIQMYLNHPNIVKMYGFFDDATHIYIIMEVGMSGQLFHQIKKALPLPEARAAIIMKQVCDAVNQIHSLRIIHRDIKPQNIVVHENVLKLCDFGWSVYQDNKMRTTFCGTPLYVCPEILKGHEYDEKIDIWSIGIMMYEMLVGENPFRITKEEQLIKIVRDDVKIPSYLAIAPQTRDFLDRCLQKNPDNRASIKQLMNHPFFKRFQQKNDKKTPTEP